MEIEVEGLGTVRLKSLSAGFWERIAGFADGAAERIRISAEAIADSLVDEKGAKVFKSADAVLEELELEYFNAISGEIMKAFGPNQQDDQIKNSGSAPASASPSTSLES